MKTLNAVGQELKKVFMGYGFWAAVGITAVLCFTTVIYTDDRNKEYSVIQVLWFGRQWMLKDVSYCSLYVFLRSSYSKLSMFIPIIAAFPFIPLFCDERKSGFIRYNILRIGKTRYNFSKFAAAVVGGGCAVALGYIIFGGIAAILFPPGNAYLPEYMEEYTSLITTSGQNVFTPLYNQIGEIAIIFSYVLEIFLYGAVASLPAFVLSSFVKNKYLILCIPFMLKYIWDMTLTKLEVSLWHEKNPDKFIGWLTQNFGSDFINSIFTMGNRTTAIAVINIVFLIICVSIFNILMNKRRDFGD